MTSLEPFLVRTDNQGGKNEGGQRLPGGMEQTREINVTLDGTAAV